MCLGVVMFICDHQLLARVKLEGGQKFLITVLPRFFPFNVRRHVVDNISVENFR